MTFTITTQDYGGFQFKKWDTIKQHSGDGYSYVVGNKRKNGGIELKLFPYEKQDSKLAQFVWFRLLKMLVFLKLI